MEEDMSLSICQIQAEDDFQQAEQYCSMAI